MYKRVLCSSFIGLFSIFERIVYISFIRYYSMTLKRLTHPKKLNKLIPAIFISVFLVWFFINSNGFHTNGDVSFMNGFLSYNALGDHPHNNVLRHLKQQNETELDIIHDKETGLEVLDYDREHIKYIYPEMVEAIYNSTDLDSVDWSKFAYVLYATSSSHMCNSMMIFAELRAFQTRAELVLLVNRDFLLKPNEFPEEHKILTEFAQNYNVILKPTTLTQIGGDEVDIWKSSFTKLMVFNETQYDRIVYLDADAIVLNDNLDELFFLPPVKLAVPTAYWLTKIKYEKLKKNNNEKKYNPTDYGFKPLTTAQRSRKISNLIDKTVTPFTLQNQVPSENNTLRQQVNTRNYQTQLYNSLPNYATIDEFELTNIVMVIQPSHELFARVLNAIENKRKNEYDMDLVQNHLFNLPKILQTQSKKSYGAYHNSLSSHLEETPEFLILPHQVYGTITPEINSQAEHHSYLADSHEQVFAHRLLETSNREPAYYETAHLDRAAESFFYKTKYLHFSDAPIPKPWFEQRPDADYMGYRTRCEEHEDFKKEGVTSPRHQTKDCSAGEKWEGVHKLFKQVRKEVCGLDLIYTKEDTYHKIIN